ncbi:MAG: hypothetical protein ACM3NO_03570 [Deltaproteobacteria bacterium]
MTTLQNGATFTSRYRLDGSKTKNLDADRVETEDRARFRKTKLEIESVVVARSGEPSNAPNRTRITQTWELSPDGRTLTISNSSILQGRAGKEIYSRRAGMNDATAESNAASETNRCNAYSADDISPQKPDYSKGVFLGETGFRQFGKTTSFDAGLAGDFLKGLVRRESPSGYRFQRNGKPVEVFPDLVLVELEPNVVDPASREVGTFVPLPTGASAVPDELLRLRFDLKWTGSQMRDLGEVSGELMTEPWPELRPPRRWYKLEVPSKNIPLTDTLEIRILSSDGRQVGCISGHI